MSNTCPCAEVNEKAKKRRIAEAMRLETFALQQRLQFVGVFAQVVGNAGRAGIHA